MTRVESGFDLFLSAVRARSPNVSLRRESSFKLKMDEAAAKWPRHRAATKREKAKKREAITKTK